MDLKAKTTALRGFSYGVYIVGSRNPEGDVNAFLGTWVTQTSFDPPMVAIAVKQGTTSQQMVAASGVFTVNVLETGQKDLAARFFKPVTRVGNKFDGLEFYTAETGSPILKDALSFLECRVVERIERGDHFVYLGEIINAGVHREGESLGLRETGWKYGG